MKTGNKIAFFYTAMTVGIIALVTVAFYFIATNYISRLYYSYLTEKAYDIQRRMEADRKKLDKSLTRGMTKKEVAAVTRALEKMLYNIADP